jgi:hypothetical protein
MLEFLEDVSGVKLFFIIMMALIITYIIQYITILNLYKPLFQWWSDNGGKKYYKFFNMMTVATAKQNTIMYYINGLRGGPLNKINITQLQFLIGRIFPFMRFLDENKQQEGILTPKSICETVLLSPNDGDQMFDNWFRNATRGADDMSIKEGANLVYTKSGPIHSDIVPGNTYYVYTFTPNTGDESKVSGIYPKSPRDTKNWTGLILEWLGPNWGVAPDATKTIDQFVPLTAEPDYTVWMKDGKGRGDNFLARYGIYPDSPLVTYFCNGRYSTQGMKIDSTAFINLIAPQGASIAGGWIGYVNGLGDENNDTLSQILFSKVDYPIPKNLPTCTPPDYGKGVMSAVSSFLGIAVMAVMPGIGVPGLIATIAGAAVVGGISGAQAGAGTC